MLENNFFRNQYIAFIASKINVEVHRHSTFQMVISLDNVFNSNVKQEAIEDIEIILFNQFVPHSCFTKDSKVLVYLVEPDSYLGALIKFFYKKKIISSWFHRLSQVQLKEMP
jgi:hypothetical protein